jgi:hypothetical protein
MSPRRSKSVSAPQPAAKPITMLGVRLPTPLHRRLRIYALKVGRPVQHLIVQAVRDLLAKE